MKSFVAPPGLGATSLAGSDICNTLLDHDHLVFLILSELKKNRIGKWMSLMQIYASSSAISHQNSLASVGLRAFIKPSDLMKAAGMETCLTVRERNKEWDVSLRPSNERNTSRVISAVLRYDVAGWIRMSALQILLNSRFGVNMSLGVLLIAIIGDPVRFEMTMWAGEWWAHAKYRYDFD